MREERPRCSMCARVLNTAAFAVVWGFFAAPASADLVDIFAEHEFRLVTQQPFATADTTDFTSGLINGTATYVNTEFLSPGSDTSTASQIINVTANRITAELEATTQAAGGIASANFEGTLTLDAATDLIVSGSSNGGFGSFTGGSSLTLVREGDPFSNALIALTGLDGINYNTAIPGPIALTAGRYDFKISTSLAGGAVGTRLHAVTLQFGAGGTVPGDFDNTGQVDQGDLDLVLLNWGDDASVTGTPAGWVNDPPVGLIGQTQLDGVLLNWGSTTEPGFAASTAVPEPAAVTAVLLGVAALTRRHHGTWLTS